MKTLLIVDLQNDFMEGGALPVKGGRAMIPLINRLQDDFDLIVACHDWHPRNHCCFVENHPGKKVGDRIEFAGHSQELWPTHCVQGTVGAKFAIGLKTDHWAKVFEKGTDPNIDSYSAFFDNAKQRSTGLTEYFKAQKVTEFYVVGVAVEHCIKASVLDALEMGFQPIVIVDGTRAICLRPEDVVNAFTEMKQAGSHFMTSKEFFQSVRE